MPEFWTIPIDNQYMKSHERYQIMFSADELDEKLVKEYKKVNSELKKPNILVAGMTGVGKSSLINMIFGEGVAKVGTGKPVTQKIAIYESDDTAVRIYDSKGYEFGEKEDAEFYKDVVGLAKNPSDEDKKVHLVWYCISCSNGRVTDYDLKAIKEFHSAGIPVAVIFTKAELTSEEDLRDLKEVLPQWAAASTFETSTINDEFNHVSDLIEWSQGQLPEIVRESFVKAQTLDVSLKWKKAHLIIGQHAATAFGVGFVPIPFADAPILVANEIALVARILSLYDLSSLKDIVKGTVLDIALSSVGKSLAHALVKLLPGGGQIVGGVINGSVGAAITFALGEAVSSASCGIVKARLANNDALVETLISEFGSTVSTLVKEYYKSGKTKAEDYSFEG